MASLGSKGRHKLNGVFRWIGILMKGSGFEQWDNCVVSTQRLTLFEIVGGFCTPGEEMRVYPWH